MSPAPVAAAAAATLVAATAMGRAIGSETLGLLGLVAFGAWMAIDARAIGRRAAPFLALAGAAAAAALAVADAPGRVMLAAALQGAGLSALILAVGLIQCPADRARLMRRAGEALIRQGPGRRYAALTGGAFALAALLNLGAVNLLAALLQRSNTLAAAGGDPRIKEIRERRMATALLRGFGASPLWAPAAISVSVVASAVPTASWIEFGPWCLALALTWLVAGWGLDRLSWPRAQRVRPTLPAPTHGIGALAPPVAGLLAALLALTGGLKLATGLPLPSVVLLVGPTIAALWLIGQGLGRGVGFALARAAIRLFRHGRDRLPAGRYEAMLLFASGFAGGVLAELLPPEAARAAMAWTGLGGVGLAAALTAVVALCGQVALGPIVPALVLGPAAVALGPEPLHPSVVAIALLAGWGLCVTTTPIGAAALIVARAAGDKPAGTVARAWNFVYALLAWSLAAGALAAADWAFGRASG